VSLRALGEIILPCKERKQQESSVEEMVSIEVHVLLTQYDHAKEKERKRQKSSACSRLQDIVAGAVTAPATHQAVAPSEQPCKASYARVMKERALAAECPNTFSLEIIYSSSSPSQLSSLN
jgi:hypothetical protein